MLTVAVIDFIRRRCLSVFGHIARLTQGTPAHNALHCQVGLASGRSLGGMGDVVLVVIALAGHLWKTWGYDGGHYWRSSPPNVIRVRVTVRVRV